MKIITQGKELIMTGVTKMFICCAVIFVVAIILTIVLIKKDIEILYLPFVIALCMAFILVALPLGFKTRTYPMDKYDVNAIINQEGLTVKYELTEGDERLTYIEKPFKSEWVLYLNHLPDEQNDPFDKYLLKSMENS